MEFRELSYLLAIERYRNLTRAAQNCYISQSGLSKFLGRTEKELGFALFLRSGSSLEPTPIGAAYLDFARKVVALKQELDHRVAELAGGETPALHVGVCINSISMHQEAIEAFSRLYPEIPLTVTEEFSAVLVQMLQKGELDIAFLGYRHVRPDWVAEPITRSELALYLPEGVEVPPVGRVPFSERPWVDLGALGNVGFVCVRRDAQSSFGEEAVFREYGVRPASLRFVKSLTSKVQLARKTASACFLVIDPHGRPLLDGFSDYGRLYSFGTHPHCNEVTAVYRREDASLGYLREYVRLAKHFQTKAKD